MTTYYISAFGNAKDQLGDTLEWDSSTSALSFAGIPGETNTMINRGPNTPKQVFINLVGATWRCILIAPSFPPSVTSYSLAGTVIVESAGTQRTVYFCAFTKTTDPYEPGKPAPPTNNDFCSYRIRIGESSNENGNPFFTNNLVRKYLAPSSNSDTYFEFIHNKAIRLQINKLEGSGDLTCLYIQGGCNPWGDHWPIPTTWRATWQEPSTAKTFTLVFVELASESDPSGQMVGLVQDDSDFVVEEVTGVFGAEYP